MASENPEPARADPEEQEPAAQQDPEAAPEDQAARQQIPGFEYLPEDHPLEERGYWRQIRSSSGRIYYYNQTTQVSQWDKPREWTVQRQEGLQSEPEDRQESEAD